LKKEKIKAQPAERLRFAKARGATLAAAGIILILGPGEQ